MPVLRCKVPEQTRRPRGHRSSLTSHPYTHISPGSHREALYRKDNRYSTRYFSSGISRALSLRTGEVPAGSPVQRVLRQEAIIHPQNPAPAPLITFLPSLP